MEIYSLIQSLINKVVESKIISLEDEIFVRNKLISLLDLIDFQEVEDKYNEQSIPDILEKIEDYAISNSLINNSVSERDIFSTNLMDVFMPRPSDLNKFFYEQYNRDPELATTFFYELSKNSNYIQTKRIAKNMSFKIETSFGELDITINLSKPEKDPKEIEMDKISKSDTSSSYPKCLLCIENEGYEGRFNHPARASHRMIRMNLSREQWYFQYSPYVYYNEHCILLSGEHRDMKINKSTFMRLLDFVKQFPHYFMGSNADLPIVGGSILSHDHFQGGKYEFAMAKAPEEMAFLLNRFPSVQAATIKWPMSVIRLKSNDSEELIQAADYILSKWITYSDYDVNIKSNTGDTQHNTITPIARSRNGEYELDLVLRNNRTSEQHPMGIFHPHQDVQHIKRENIGLIEVMGLAVLPARLKNELEDVCKYLLAEENGIKEYHFTWANEIKDRYMGKITSDSVNEIVMKEVGLKFLRVLEDAGVFKRDLVGKRAFRRFILSL